jgi:chlorinating enzyme
MSALQDAFASDGFVTGVPILDGEELRSSQAWLNDLEKRRGGMLAGQEVNTHLDDEVAWNIATHPSVLDIVAELLGTSDLFLLSTTVFTKYPEHLYGPKKVGWHQDLLLWNLDPGDVVNTWIALETADEENGCMQALPGSHKQGFFEHGHDPNDTNNVLMGFQNIDITPAGGLDLAEPRMLVLPAGHMCAHDGFTVHGSAPNRSANRRRSGFSAQYMPAYVKVGEDKYAEMKTHERNDDWRKPILVRGNDTFKVNVEKEWQAPAFARVKGSVSVNTASFVDSSGGTGGGASKL